MKKFSTVKSCCAVIVTLSLAAPFCARATVSVSSWEVTINTDACSTNGPCHPLSDTRSGSNATGSDVQLGPISSSTFVAGGFARGSAGAGSQIQGDSTDNAALRGSVGGDCDASSTDGVTQFNASASGKVKMTFSVTASAQFTLHGIVGYNLTAANSNDASNATATVRLSGVFEQSYAGGADRIEFNRTGTLLPGNYTVEVFFNNTASGGSRKITSSGGNFQLFLQPAPTANEIHWVNTAGGSFGTATNWNPQTVPTSTKTALFDPAAVYTVTGGGSSRTSERAIISNGNVTFNNLIYTLGATSFDAPSFVVDNAQLSLSSNVALGTQLQGVHGLIGAGGAARVDVNEDAFLAFTGSLRIGGAGNGFLAVANGGTVVSEDTRIGNGAGGGDAFIGGSVADWVTENFAVGYSGAGTLTIDGGAEVSTGTMNAPADAFVGYNQGVTGLAIVQGADANNKSSLWKITSALVVGKAGTGDVQIKQKGEVETDSLRLGVEAGSSGRLSIDSLSSLLCGAVSVGGEGKGTLLINSALVAGHIHIGSTGAAARVVVDGSQSSLGALINMANLFVGTARFVNGSTAIEVAATGELEILDAGSVDCASATLGKLSGSLGNIYVGRIGGAAATLQVNGDLIVGDAGVAHLGLSNSAAQVTVGGTLGVGAHGTVAGIGTLSAPTRLVTNGGFISPGLSPGTLTIDANFQQTATGTLRIEAAGLSAGQFDVLHVTGNATLGGTLEMLFLHGYLPKTGDVIPFLAMDGNVTGDFAQISFPQLLPGFQVKPEIVNGTYQLTALNDAVAAPTATPTIGVSVSPSSVNEGSSAIFTISTSTMNPFVATTVAYSLKGKAQLGADYDVSGAFGQVDIPAGALSATVTLDALTDDLKEKNEKLTLTLSKNPEYNLSKSKKAKLTIVDVPPP